MLQEVVLRGRTRAVIALLVCALGLACATARLQRAQAAFARAVQLENEGKHSDALREAERARALAEELWGPDHPEVAQCLNLAGTLYRTRGDQARAGEYLHRGLSIRERALGKDHVLVAQSLYALAKLYSNQGHYPESQAALERALAIEEAQRGPQHLEVAYVLDDLSFSLKSQGRYERAVTLLERALAIEERELGKSHPSVATLLEELGSILRAQGRNDQAEPLLARALDIRESSGGKADPTVAVPLNGLGLIAIVRGQYPRAVPLLQRALDIRQAAMKTMEVTPADSFDLAISLSNLAFVYEKQGQFGLAEPLYVQALATAEGATGKTHPAVARPLNNLAELYQQMGEYDRARPLYERSLAIVEASLGKNHPDAALLLSNLGQLDIAQGRFGGAEALFRRALALLEVAPGKLHPEAVMPLNNLANLYAEQGLYARAEPLYRQALALQESAYGPAHPGLVLTLHNLGYWYVKQGLYRHGEPLLQRAIRVAEESLGVAHPDLATPLTGLANLYVFEGLYGRAEPLYQRALSIRESALGPKHSLVAMSLHNLGSLYGRQGAFERAIPLEQRALAIQRAALGPSHPEVAYALQSFGDMLVAAGRDEQAEAFYDQALSIREAAFGPAHPDVAETLGAMAVASRYAERSDRAEALYKRALAIWERSFSPAHPQLADLLDSYALLRVKQGRLDDAVGLLTRAMTIAEGRLRGEALDFSGARLSEFLDHLDGLEAHLDALLRAHPERADVRRLALAAALSFRGRSVEEAADTSRAILRGLGPDDRSAFARLRELRTRFAKRSLEGPGRDPPARLQAELQGISREADALEADLARRSAPLRALTALPPPERIVDQVAAALPAGGALVELIEYPDQPLDVTPRTYRPPERRYLALVLFPDGHTGAADLGPAATIDGAAERLRDALAGQDVAYEVHAKALYQLVFRPLLPLLGGARTLYLAPDGQLALVPFAALHDGRGFLADRYQMSYVSAGRDLLPRPDPPSHPDAVVVFADPDYGARPRPANQSRSVDLVVERGGQLDPRRWIQLPGTRQESEAIQRLFPRAQLFLGPDATKERLLGLPAPDILHVATHGFFLEDAAGAAAPERARGVAISGPAGGEALPRPPDPLLRSGLLLAGARAPDALGDSLVTALELAGLDLWGTELVVLSACDTGRGDVKLGQGVYGLRRALVVAGAETLVVSLWRVDDRTTRELMERYYRALLSGEGRARALQAAMRSLRAEHPHPHFWAPFISTGRDAPLRGPRGVH